MALEQASPDFPLHPPRSASCRPQSSQQIRSSGLCWRRFASECSSERASRNCNNVRDNLLAVRFPFEGRPALVGFPLFLLRRAPVDIPVFISARLNSSALTR